MAMITGTPPPPPTRPGLTYAEAGVDIAEGDALIHRIAPAAVATARPGVMGGLGGFAALFDVRAAGFHDPLIVSATDGVGTKLEVAQACGGHRHIGQDLVAMCVNDLVTVGATPLFFLDYFATGRLESGIAATVIEGIAAACGAAGCALIGGETAEMPGLYGPGVYDLAGFAVGAVEREAVLPRHDRMAAGDPLIGLPSTGIHANGFSLVRAIVERSGLHYTDPAPFAPGQTLGEALLTPTRLYVRPALALARAGLAHGFAHITGGGLPGNTPRMLPASLAIAIDRSRWTPPAVFAWLATTGGVAPAEMARVFNLGIGFVAAVPSARVDEALSLLRDLGEAPVVIGSLEARDPDAPACRFTGPPTGP